MHTELDYTRFRLSYPAPAPGGQPALCLIFYKKSILAAKGRAGLPFPLETEMNGAENRFSLRQYLGQFDGHPCYCMEAIDETPVSAEYAYEDIHTFCRGCGDEGLSSLAGTAYHVLHWSRCNRYCGQCGAPMQDKPGERARRCGACGAVVYPRISPAIIVAVRRGDSILLAHNNSFKGGFYSVVAGFVEPGETLERCVEREVGEETGIEIQNIRYFSSQPWPFPDSLMIGFTAEYKSGAVLADGSEIGSAGFFRYDSLPPIPGEETIAGRMIRSFIKSCRQPL